MKHDEDVFEDHYPTTVMERRHHGVEQLNGELFALIKELERRYSNTEENAVKTGLVATQGGYQTSTKMNIFQLKQPGVETFRDDVVMPAVRRYLEKVFGEHVNELNPWPRGWATLLHSGDWQKPHMHPVEKNVASAVYYVKLPDHMPEPQGCIEFLNPHPLSVHHGFSLTRLLQPEEGKLIIFPPYHIHYVHPFQGEGDRAIISFDVLAQPPGPQFVI